MATSATHITGPGPEQEEKVFSAIERGTHALCIGALKGEFDAQEAHTDANGIRLSCIRWIMILVL